MMRLNGGDNGDESASAVNDLGQLQRHGLHFRKLTTN